jgi:hypothetical protein
VKGKGRVMNGNAGRIKIPSLQREIQQLQAQLLITEHKLFMLTENLRELGFNV